MRRDPFGERPLYYAVTAEGVRAGPSAVRLQAEAGLPRGLDPEAAAAALCGALAPERSLFHAVGRVPPAHELLNDGWRVVPYWQPPLLGRDAALPEEPSAEELLRHLRAAVRRRPADAVALSGGVDSAALLALAAEAGAHPRVCIRVDDFTDAAERARAVALAAAVGVEPILVEVAEQELPEHAAEAVRACEDLLWNGRAVANLLFFRRARAAGVATLLSGVGADEVLCGNPEALAGFEDRLEAEAALARSLLTPAAERAVSARPRPVVPPGVDPLVFRQDVFLRTVLPDSTLPPECRGAAAEGIEVRLPYLDLDLADFVLRLSVPSRLRNRTGKWLLREALAALLPDDVRWQPKQPRLAPPGGGSPRARERWLVFYETWLSPARLARLGCVVPSRVRSLLDGFARAEPANPERALQDVVLMRLASLAVLAEQAA